MNALFPALLISLALAISSPAADQKVYICTGPKSVCYHKTKTCSDVSYYNIDTQGVPGLYRLHEYALES